MQERDLLHFHAHEITIEDARYRVLVALPRDRANVLILHGFTGRAESNMPLARTLRDAGFGIIMPDLLGHGRTIAPYDPIRYRMEQAAADLLTLCDQIDPAKLHLVGYSMGGRLALYLATQQPDRWYSLVLESASPGLADPIARAERRAEDNLLAAEIEARGIEWFVRYWGKLPLWRTQNADQREALRRERLQNDPKGLATSLRGMGTGVQPSLWNDLDRITCPTLLIAGRRDSKFLEVAHAMQARMRQARLSVFPGTGHAVHVEKPEDFQRQVLGFLADCE
ncbi:MAG: 2-succinyl-6-hydroxy-2,4-cyclohexadiene-1-carboxylate synthase [Anaerolineae bacterium]|nr:2-succinyl-6-hydroxy-2,4-cyclohexadiene-1-carboxylate synthase [Anaerolineae bacterium]MDW8170876.1 2-succinyl-6-hydroxy-2,4-cyclohexadiene-1-carboxylate synthase [Anaerolineae bacterium]